MNSLPKTRKEAQLKQSIYYFTGNPCKHGHTSKRVTANSTCWECSKLSCNTHRKANIDKYKEDAKEYYVSNRENVLEKSKAWRDDNKEAKANLDKQYRDNNKDRLKQKSKEYYDINSQVLKQKSNQYYYDNKVDLREKGKKYHKERYYPANKEKLLKYGKVWRQNNRGKVVAYNANRRALLTNATPFWCEVDKITELYKKCAELNEKWAVKFQVDHVIPIQGKNVCGLHCWDNLQLLDGTLNNEKNNKWD